MNLTRRSCTTPATQVWGGQHVYDAHRHTHTGSLCDTHAQPAHTATHTHTAAGSLVKGLLIVRKMQLRATAATGPGWIIHHDMLVAAFRLPSHVRGCTLYAACLPAGCTGETLEFTYRRALLVLWPRVLTLDHARRAGFDAMYKLLQHRVAALQELQQHASDSSSDAAEGQSSTLMHSTAADRLQKAQQDVLQVLTACVECVRRDLADQTAQVSCDYYTKWRTDQIAEKVSPLLQQALRVLQLGVQGACPIIAGVLDVIASPFLAEKLLGNPELAGQFADVTGLLVANGAEQHVRQPLLQLVSSCMAAQRNAPAPGAGPPVPATVTDSLRGACIKLIVCKSSKPALQQQLAEAALAAYTEAVTSSIVEPLLSLTASATALPALQQPVADRLTAAMQVGGSTAAEVAGAVSAGLHLLEAAQVPQLHGQLAAAALAAVKAAGLAAHLTSCVGLLRAFQKQQQPEMQQQLVTDIADALRSSTDADPACRSLPSHLFWRF